MNPRLFISAILLAATLAAAQDAPPQEAPAPESHLETRYSVAVINDLTFYSDLTPSLPASADPSLKAPTVTMLQNQLLLEPSFNLRYRSRWSFGSSMVGVVQSYGGLSTADFNIPPGNPGAIAALNAALEPYTGTHTQLHVKETYAGLSAGDFDFMLGRRMVRWGTGYAFTAAGVLDPPRMPTNPTDRLNVNEGRDMVKADWVHGTQAISAAWSTAALAPARPTCTTLPLSGITFWCADSTPSLIAGHDRGGDTFGALTFTRVVGQAWELHGEAVWREQAAVSARRQVHHSPALPSSASSTLPLTFLTTATRTFLRLAGRQHYAFLNAGKRGCASAPGGRNGASRAHRGANLDDRSYTGIFDANRWFGNHFSSYVHLEVPAGSKTSEYGSAPYAAATSVGVRFQL